MPNRNRANSLRQLTRAADGLTNACVDRLKRQLRGDDSLIVNCLPAQPEDFNELLGRVK